MLYYPAFFNLKGKRALLFGAGTVALRKAKSLVESGAQLSVISLDFSAAFLRYAKSKKIKLKKSSKIPKQLNGISLVIAATSNTTFNRSVYEVCKRKGIWINVVDDPEHSSFIVPAVVQRGSLQIAISTGGASPFLAKLLRRKFESELSIQYAGLIRLLKKQRMKAKQTISHSKDRRAYFYRLVKSKLKQLDNRKN